MRQQRNAIIAIDVFAEKDIKRIIEMGYYDYTNKISELLNDARYELSEKEFMNLIDDIIYMAEEWRG